MRYVIRKDGEMSTLGVHRNSFDEALATAAEMIAMRDDENSIVVEDTWENRTIDETEIASLIDARSPDPMRGWRFGALPCLCALRLIVLAALVGWVRAGLLLPLATGFAAVLGTAGENQALSLESVSRIIFEPLA